MGEIVKHEFQAGRQRLTCGRVHEAYHPVHSGVVCILQPDMNGLILTCQSLLTDFDSCGRGQFTTLADRPCHQHAVRNLCKFNQSVARNSKGL
ncbi:MAG: hypothetical protein HPKKFMNG_01236 [Planctomycetes bacterium]|nr:hypothetical protein [Planctomycetota bacterium]